MSSIPARGVLFWPFATGDTGSIPSRGRRLFDSVVCSEDFPAIMLYSWPNKGQQLPYIGPTTPFKIGIPRNPGQDLLARATA